MGNGLAARHRDHGPKATDKTSLLDRLGHGSGDLGARSRIDGRLADRHRQSGQGDAPHALPAVHLDLPRLAAKGHMAADGRAVGGVRVVAAVLDDGAVCDLAVAPDLGQGHDQPAAAGQGHVNGLRDLPAQQQQGGRLGRAGRRRAGGEAFAQCSLALHDASAPAATKAAAAAGLLPKCRCT